MVYYNKDFRIKTTYYKLFLYLIIRFIFYLLSLLFIKIEKQRNNEGIF